MMKKRVFSVLLTAMLLMGFAIPCLAANPLENQIALFLGDSIAAGYTDTTYGFQSAWAKRIGDANKMMVTNRAENGATLSTVRDNRILRQIRGTSGAFFSYVILQGGINDAMGSNSTGTKESAAPIGKVSASYNVQDFNTATYAGALEEAIYYILQYHPEAKVGYIITYATPRSKFGGYTADADHMRQQWEVGKAVCDKWGIGYLDLFDGKSADGKSYSNDILRTGSDDYLAPANDSLHLNGQGYDVISPYIAEWMKTLQPSPKATTKGKITYTPADEGGYFSPITSAGTTQTTAKGGQTETTDGSQAESTTTLPDKKGMVVEKQQDQLYYDEDKGPASNVTVVVLLIAGGAAFLAGGVAVAITDYRKKHSLQDEDSPAQEDNPPEQGE